MENPPTRLQAVHKYPCTHIYTQLYDIPSPPPSEDFGREGGHALLYGAFQETVF